MRGAVASAIGAAVLALAASTVFLDAAPSEVPLLFVQEPMAGAAGSRIVGLWPDGELHVLTEDFADAAEPNVSHDGTWVLFAGRRHAEDGWEIWRMARDGTHQEQITHGMADARAPVWLAPAAVNAPTFDAKIDWIAFTSTKTNVYDERGSAPLANLYAMSLAPVGDRGHVVWRTTFGLGGDLAPTVLADGRILFSSWQRDGYALMTISWAGENLNPLFGSHDGHVSQVSARELPGQRTVVFVEVDGDATAAGGRLAALSMRRPLHSRQVLAEDGAYRTPAPLPDDRLVVAWRASTASSFGLYAFNIGSGDIDSGRGELIYDDPDWHDVAPAPVAPRPVPRGRIPTVDFASVLDIKGFERAGQLQCLDVNETDRPELAAVAGRARRVRLVEGLPLTQAEVRQQRQAPVPSMSDWPPAFVRTRPLGEAPIEADGSFYVNVAGDVPFYIETLDDAGKIVAVMRTWMWVRAGDQRGCVGCHEDKELAPENRVTQALLRARPTSLMGPSQGAP